MEYAAGFSIYILQQTSAKTWITSISVRSNVRSVSGGRGVWPKEYGVCEVMGSGVFSSHHGKN